MSRRPKVTIVDFNSGNLFSVARALETCDADVVVTPDPQAVGIADRLILPGVGSFGAAMTALKGLGLADSIHQFVATGRPFLGICVGMQVLFEEGEEFGRHEGLGLIPGKVVAIPKTAMSGEPHKVPHIGWSDIIPVGDPARWLCTALAHLTLPSSMYFVHSFTSWPTHEANRLADAFHNGRRIAAVVAKDNMLGCQFHPERSGNKGIGILRRFVGTD